MKLVFKTPPDGNYFFGYFDKSPLDAGNERLLALRALFMDRMPGKDDLLAIGYFPWRQGSEFVEVAQSRAWNWQQGCMLQWLGPDFGRRILFNDRRDGRFVSVILDLESGAEEVLPLAAYTVNRQGSYALGIDNERHYWWRPGYNYQGIENPAKRRPVDDDDGIWRLDLETGVVEQVVNIVALLGMERLSSMRGAAHYLEQVNFSPSGKRFCFLHRWILGDGSVYSRLISAEAGGGEICLLSDSGRLSHFSWLDDERIIAYGSPGSLLSRLRRNRRGVASIVRPLLPLYRRFVPLRSSLRRAMTGDGYFVIRDRTAAKRRVAPGVLRSDGHPSVCPADPTLLVSDTYEDGENYRELFLFDLDREEKTWSTRLRSRAEYDSTSLRADLHPRWSRDGGMLAIDTMNDGCRSMYLYRTATAVEPAATASS